MEETEGAAVTVDELGKFRLCKVKEACEVLQVSRSKVYELMDSGLLESVRLGGSRRIPRSALIRAAKDGLVAQRE